MTVNNVNNGLKILLCVHRFDYTCEVQSFENASTNKVKWQKNNKNRKKKSTINQPNHALKLKWNESSIRSHLPYCNVHPSETDYQKRKNIGRDLVLSISCWLDGGRPECELEVDYKKGVEFKQTKWLETSGICHQKEVFHFKGSLSLKWLKLLNYNVNFFTFKKCLCKTHCTGRPHYYSKIKMFLCLTLLPEPRPMGGWHSQVCLTAQSMISIRAVSWASVRAETHKSWCLSGVG